ncbi:MAG: hypothetical protein Q9187_007811 [Circinaria calcarea]
MPFRGFVNHDARYFVDKAAHAGQDPNKFARPVAVDTNATEVKDSDPTAGIEAQTKALQIQDTTNLDAKKIRDRAILDAKYSRRKAAEARELGVMPRKSNVSQATAATADEATPVKEQDGINIEVCSARFLNAFCIVLRGLRDLMT